MLDKVASSILLLVVGLVALFILASCESGGDKDIGGTTLTMGEWKAINEKESSIYYTARKKVNISSIKVRYRDEQEYHEQVSLVTDSNHPSFIYATYLPYGVHYTLGTTEFLLDKSKIVELAKSSFAGASLSQAINGQNANGRYSDGKYLYVVGKYEDGVNCVMARQGLAMRLTAAEETDTYYDAIVSFRYCSQESVQNIIDIFDNITMKLE